MSGDVFRPWRGGMSRYLKINLLKAVEPRCDFFEKV